MHNLACLLHPQEIYPQSPVITDTGLLRIFPREFPFLYENNILRDLRACYEISGLGNCHHVV
jgi:hypothetical protein